MKDDTTTRDRYAKSSLHIFPTNSSNKIFEYSMGLQGLLNIIQKLEMKTLWFLESFSRQEAYYSTLSYRSISSTREDVSENTHGVELARCTRKFARNFHEVIHSLFKKTTNGWNGHIYHSYGRKYKYMYLVHKPVT